MKLLGHGYARDVRSTSVRFSKGDVLYGKMRPYLNKVWAAEFDGLCSAEFLVFPKAAGLSSEFLAMRLNMEDFVTFANRQVSGERPRVDFKKLSVFPLLLPPTAEQERIAAKLNAALAASRRAENASRRAQERLTRYRAAVLNASVKGDLTKDWRETYLKGQDAESGVALLRRILKARGDEWSGKGKYREPAPPVVDILPSTPEGWTTASLEQLTSANRVICYGILMPKEHVSGGVPYVKVRDMKEGQINVASLSRTSPKIAAQYGRSSLKPGDLLLAIRGTYGRVVEVPPQLEGGNITQDTARLAITPLVDRYYIASFLRSDYSQDYFKRVARGVAVRGVNIGDVRPCPIHLAPYAEQVEIVHELDRRIGAADRLAGTLAQQLARANESRKSLLSQAFSGQLIAQDTKDEPASVLVERLLVTRKTEAQKPRGKRMPKTTSQTKATGQRNLLAVLKVSGGPMTPEELFRASGYSQDSVDQFFAELRELTTPPARIVEERKGRARTFLRVLP